MGQQDAFGRIWGRFHLRWVTGTAVLGLLSAPAFPGAAPVPAEPAADTSELREILITAPEPRYVAPTRRDRIGRIWAPVFINGQGPFRMALDTGSTNSTVRAEVAAKLGIIPNPDESVRIRGVAGTSIVPTMRVQSMIVGDMALSSQRLPIILDPLGGADGILGNEGLRDKRIYIDFLNDFITIRLSRSEPAPEGFLTLPFEYGKGDVPIVDARLGRIPVKAIISTGGEMTLANLAARDALLEQRKQEASVETITDVTETSLTAEGYRTPPISLGDTIRISTPRMTFSDLAVFDSWGMSSEPTIMIGMDAIGLLDTLIIDYRRQELQILMRSGTPRALF